MNADYKGKTTPEETVYRHSDENVACSRKTFIDT